MKTNVEGFTNRTIINEEAAKWVLMLEDTPILSHEQITELNNWIGTSAVHRDCLESMVNSWAEMDLLSSVMLPQEMHKPSGIKVILTYMLLPIVASIKRCKNLLRPIVVAPIIIASIAWLSILMFQPQPTDRLVYATKMGESLNHTLPDGSVLWLNSSTELQVNYSDNYRRINLYKGEAHFEVTKDSTRPFEVYVDDRLVRAIGTAFSVHKSEGNIEVLVSEGTVELAIVDNTLVIMPDDLDIIKDDESFNQQKADRNLASKDDVSQNSPAKVTKLLGTLTAGQRIRIPTQDNNLSDVVELDTSEVSRFLSWKEGKLVFAGESLEEVIKEITRHTQVKIDVIDPQLKTMRIGGQFQVGETDTLFYVLESGFGISVEKLDDYHVQLRVKAK